MSIYSEHIFGARIQHDMRSSELYLNLIISYDLVISEIKQYIILTVTTYYTGCLKKREIRVYRLVGNWIETIFKIYVQFQTH